MLFRKGAMDGRHGALSQGLDQGGSNESAQLHLGPLLIFKDEIDDASGRHIAAKRLAREVRNRAQAGYPI
jgi:hypothetical protein